jgi:hypothetical protein
MQTAEKTGKQLGAEGKMSGKNSGSFTPCTAGDSLLEALQTAIKNVFSGQKRAMRLIQKGGVFERLEAGLKAVCPVFAGLFQLEPRGI